MKRIVLEGIEKNFRIGFKKNQTVLARVISVFSGKEPKKILHVLKGISFSADRGEIVGMVGKNGSGKSTLLRIIAGIYEKDKGNIMVNGNLISLIGLGSGFQPRLTTKENILLVGSLFGLSQKTIRKRFNSIIEFAELEDFVNTKLYQFSEGMKQRLAFSIAINCEPDILLLDEVFEVGDQKFRFKSSEKIKELAKKGTTVLLVSHELWMIEKHCSRVIWLDKGKIMMDGKVEEVMKEYKR